MLRHLRALVVDMHGYTRMWVPIVGALILFGGIIGKGTYAYRSAKSDARKNIKAEEPAVVGCIHVKADTYMCLSHDQQLVWCDSDGCNRPTLKLPDNL